KPNGPGASRYFTGAQSFRKRQLTSSLPGLTRQSIALCEERWMPGLDPSIHRSSHKAMDCRVKPGNDEVS
ncbi:MAG TPA: hypothetical protein VHG27_05995, partial [Xanthobacteraceae bacterium]|nr:hypothetical protein [Xanthobacteraceae bacterium]